MAFGFAVILSVVTGFISLSYELLWFRIISFASGGLAASFGILLAAYLGGIAVGSYYAGKLCKTVILNASKSDSITLLAWFLLMANGISYVVIPITTRLVCVVDYYLSLGFVLIAAAFLGAAFPLISHFSVSMNDKVGSKISFLYLGNIIGSTCGTLFTGFLLMDYLSTAQIALLLCITGLVTALIVHYSTPRSSSKVKFSITAVVCIFFALVSQPLLYHATYERLLLKEHYRSDYSFTHLVENKSGVIATDFRKRLYGGGVYDGTFNIDPFHDSNDIFRAYAISALHRKPSEILMIGLGTGSWAAVMAHLPGVKFCHIIEINPGYLRLLPSYPLINSLLNHAKVKITIDDGRRWLHRNPERKFDVIVSNTTYNWRMFATNLLSVEFLELIKKHLKPGGMYFYNTTFSKRAQKTGLRTFQHGLLIHNCLALSDTPLQFDRKRFEQILLTFKVQGKRFFSSDDRDAQERLDFLRNLKIINKRELSYQFDADMKLITDDNMGTEWYSLDERSSFTK